MSGGVALRGATPSRRTRCAPTVPPQEFRKGAGEAAVRSCVAIAQVRRMAHERGGPPRDKAFLRATGPALRLVTPVWGTARA